MKFVGIIISLTFIACTGSKQALLTDIKNYSVRAINTDSVLKFIEDQSDLVIGYTVSYPAWGLGTTYFLFALRGNHWIAYKYFVKPVIIIGDKPYDLDSFVVAKPFSDSVLRDFKKMKSWELRTQKRPNDNNCPYKDYSKGMGCSIFDAETEALIIMSKSYHNSVSFYAPQYFEYECCPGWTDRQRYLTSVELIRKFFWLRRNL